MEILQTLHGSSSSPSDITTWANLIMNSLENIYSGAQKKVYVYCFMKQNCQIQMGIAQYKNVATPLGFWGIDTTHQRFQMRYEIFF